MMPWSTASVSWSPTSETGRALGLGPLMNIKCWPVKAVLDPVTGDVIRKEHIAYRDPTLLDYDVPEPAGVWRGTDLPNHSPPQR